MGQDKNTFIELRKSEIEMEKAFIKSCDVLIKHAKKWNGKVINSRFANAMDEEINKAVKFFGRNGDTRKTIGFYIEKPYGGPGLFALKYNNRYNGNCKEYIGGATKVLCHPGNTPYINNGRLDAALFIKCLDECKGQCSMLVKDKEAAIKNIDKAIASYQELGRIIKSTLEGMPKCLRGYISIDAPINY